MCPTVYRMQLECDFNAQLRAAVALQLPHVDGLARNPLFFLQADGKAHNILAGGHGSTKKSPGAMACHCCSANRSAVWRTFGGQEVALERNNGRTHVTAVFRDTPSDRRISDLGAHEIMCVAIARLNRTVSVLITTEEHRTALRRGRCKALSIGHGKRPALCALESGGPGRQMPKDKYQLGWEPLRTSSMPNCGAHCCK